MTRRQQQKLERAYRWIATIDLAVQMVGRILRARRPKVQL